MTQRWKGRRPAWSLVPPVQRSVVPWLSLRRPRIRRRHFRPHADDDGVCRVEVLRRDAPDVGGGHGEAARGGRGHFGGGRMERAAGLVRRWPPEARRPLV